MSTASFIPDLMRRAREQARTPSGIYFMAHSLPQVAVGLVPAPIYGGRLDVRMVIVSASVANGLIVEIGGPELALGAGAELVGGAAILFAAGPPAEKSFTALAPMAQVTEARTATIVETIPLNQIYAVAGGAGQTIRILYFL